MPTSPQSRPRTISTRRQLLAVVTAAFIILQSALFVSQTAAQRVIGRLPVQKPNISVTTLGSPITQNFDTLATTGTANAWADDTTLPGWFSQFSLQPTSPTTYRADAGASNTGAIYSYGTGTATERAFGSTSSGTPGDIFNALKLTNNTGSTINSLDISYIGEQWRNGGNATAQKLDFQFQVANTGVITDANTPSTGWTDFNALDFTGPIATATAAALDGNAAANRTALSSNVPVTVNNGQEVWLRWVDINDAGNDHGLAIDNFSVTPQGAGGGGQPTLSINDVTQAEGNAGTSTFTFTVSLTAAAAGTVTFDIATADGTAQDDTPATEDNDYVAKSETGRTITAGNTSATFTVTVNGDTTPEPNETFFVNVTNVTGATAGDTQGLGTITNDDVTLTGICQVQGSGTASPLATQSVTTRGIVTGIKSGTSGGFFIQDDACDADPNTSNGVFVFTGASLPAAAVVGNNVQVTGTVQEFVFASDLNSPPITEISGTVTTSVLSTGNPLPAPVTLNVANTTAASGTTNPLDTLEEFESMRVTVPSMTVVAPTDGTINEPAATVSGNDVFYGVVAGVARPFREPGVNVSDPLPAGAPANVPRFDENPERIRVDSDGQPGTTPVDVAAGSVLSNVTGPLDYSFRTYTILPDVTIVPGAQPGAVPAPVPTASELTVASFNMERFFDTLSNGGSGAPVLTQAAFDKRLDKASRIIRTVQLLPDVIGVEEVENLSTLQAVATKINNDVVAGGGANPGYVAYLSEGNDVGGIDNGFLVKESRVTTLSVTQIELAGCDHVTASTCNNYVNPNDGTLDILNDRPPLVLRATAPRPAGGTFAFTVIVNHLRSLSGVDDNTVSGSGTAGGRVREKRRKQAEFLANLIQSRQTADATEKIISVGDYNAFQFNDGFVDVIGTVKGTPSPDNTTVVPGDGADLVNPDLTDLVDTLTPAQRYSFTFDGNAQVLDHILVNDDALAAVNRFAYARDDADFPVKNYELANALRLSDHDQPIVYLSLAAAQPVGSVIISEFRFSGPCPSAPAAAPCNAAAPSGGDDSFGSPAPPVSSDGGASDAPGTPEDNDEFIEIYNNTDSDITVATTDGSPGWALVASDGAVRFIIPNGTVIPARHHFIGVNTDGYSLTAYAAPDAVLLPDGVTTASGYTQNIPNGSGIALFRTATPASFTTGERLDAVGYTTAPALYREGNGLPTGGAETTNALEYSWHRQQCAFVAGVGCTTAGTPKDTGDNATDFKSVDTTGAVQSLGAPGPESSTSPFQRNTLFPVELLDPNASSSSAPNRVRDLTPDPANNSQFGTMSIRRKVTNNTGSPITYLAFRIIQITTFPAESNATADLRARNSGDITATVNGVPVDVRGTQLEQPPNQPQGGGLNTSMAVGFLNLGGEVADGDSIDVQFLLGIMKTGTFRFYINVEALPESNVVKPLPGLKTQPRLLPKGGQRTRVSGTR